MLRRSQITIRLNPATERFADDPFFIVPCPPSLEPPPEETRTNNRSETDSTLETHETHTPDEPGYAEDGAASIDLRLGTWFLTTRQTRVPVLEISEFSALEQRLRRYCRTQNIDQDTIKKLEDALLPKVRDTQVVQSVHVRFGQDFILHPRSFVLGVTLEWFRLPSDLGGYVTGRSSWGRRGLVIATATGIHPGFTGCLTLELSNLGDIPIAIRPGMTIGQLFLHDIHRAEMTVAVDQSSFACKRRPRLGHPQPDKIAALLADVEL